MISKRVRKKPSVNRPISTCRDEVRLIGEYLNDNLSNSERAAFEAHVKLCRDCSAFLATYKRTLELARSFLRAQPNHYRFKAAGF